MSQRRIDELNYECGYLKGSMKHVEDKLERVKHQTLSPAAMSAIITDMISDLKDGREKASGAAKAHAKELWIDSKIDQAKMEAADDTSGTDE